MKTNNLPIGYEQLKAQKPYINISKLPEGTYRFRIVSRPIAGWLEWKNKKPFRTAPDKKPLPTLNEENGDLIQPKRFWALHVWDYLQKGLFVMEVTQAGILKDLENLALNEDWGDLTSYDVKIQKVGTMKETKYSVTPVPHKPVADDVKKLVESTKIRLEALYEGKDPWTDLEPGESVFSDLTLTDAQKSHIRALILEVNDDDFIDELEDLINCPVDEINIEDYDRVERVLRERTKNNKAG